MIFNKIFLINLIFVINLNCADTLYKLERRLYINTNNNNEIILDQNSKISVKCFVETTGVLGTKNASFSTSVDENVFLNKDKSIKKTGDDIFLFGYHHILQDNNHALEKYFNKKKTKCVIL